MHPGFVKRPLGARTSGTASPCIDSTLLSCRGYEATRQISSTTVVTPFPRSAATPPVPIIVTTSSSFQSEGPVDKSPGVTRPLARVAGVPDCALAVACEAARAFEGLNGLVQHEALFRDSPGSDRAVYAPSDLMWSRCICPTLAGQ